MTRREPTLSTLDTTPDAQPGVIPRRREIRALRVDVRAWIEAIFLWGLVIALAVAANLHFGWVSFSTTPDATERSLPGLVTVAGLLVIYAVQLMAFAMILFRNPLRAILTLVIPGYFFLALRREGGYRAFVIAFLLGTACFVAGVVMSS